MSEYQRSELTVPSGNERIALLPVKLFKEWTILQVEIDVNKILM